MKSAPDLLEILRPLPLFPSLSSLTCVRAGGALHFLAATLEKGSLDLHIAGASWFEISFSTSQGLPWVSLALFVSNPKKPYHGTPSCGPQDYQGMSCQRRVSRNNG